MKFFKQYLLAVVAVGVAMCPIGTLADHTAIPAPVLTQEIHSNTQNSQQDDSVVKTTEQKETAFVRNAKHLVVPAAFYLMLAGLYGLNYVWDRSIVLAHEGGHALAALATGNKVTAFHVSKDLGGGGHISVNYASDTTVIKNISIYLAGPICGAATHFMWGKLGELAVRLKHDKEHKDLSLLARIGGCVYASIGALAHLSEQLTPSICTLNASYGELAEKTVFNDGALIQETIKIVSPFLGAMYPHIVYVGLTAFAGYSAYRVYTMFKDLEKEVSKKKAAGEISVLA